MSVKFSVIIPVYKTENYLNECVDSVIQQSWKDFEVILVDDGSPDRCPEMCEGYAKKDSRVKVIHKINGGLSSARNVGLDVAVGEYVLFIDSDDYLDNRKALEELEIKLRMQQYDVLVFGMKKYYQNSNKFSEQKITTVECLQEIESIQYMMENNIFFASACDKVVRREVIERNSMRFRVGQFSEDIEWCAQLLICTSKIGFVKKPLYIYRQQNNNSISSNVKRKNLEDIMDVLERYADVDEDDDPKDRMLKHYFANQYVLWLTNASFVKKSEIVDLLVKAKKYRYLLNYTWYPYVRKVHLTHIRNVYVLRFLLGKYRLLKKVHLN